VGVDYKIDNKSAEPVQVQFYGQLKQTMTTPKDRKVMPWWPVPTVVCAFSSEDSRYKKYTLTR
jgi:YidC/Oxa1 family membrane protein insertase